MINRLLRQSSLGPDKVSGSNTLSSYLGFYHFHLHRLVAYTDKCPIVFWGN